MIGFEHLGYLLAVLPVFITGWILVKRGARHSLVMSRVTVVSLLIIALAGPYNPVTVTETDDTPSITILSDETESMDLFEENAAQEINDYLQSQMPVKMERMGGLRSDIGDEIISASEGGNHIVVISDGNNNFGRDLGETIDFISNTGTSVYAVTQTPVENDLSVEITGARTAVVGNENLVGIEIRQAQSNALYSLSVEVDGEIIQKTNENQTGPLKTIVFKYNFKSLGPHVITARITSPDDMRTDNNLFNKTIYVVPKPEILQISSDADSPLYQILDKQYDLKNAYVRDVNNLSDYKAVVLDNINNEHIPSGVVNKLREYTANGGGLVVVGGDNSYDSGDYLNSELESLLPVESYPSTYAGSVNIVLVLDFSSSLDDQQRGNMKAMAIELIEKLGEDTNSNVGIVFFAGDNLESSGELLPMSDYSNQETLIRNITDFTKTTDESKIGKGIELATSMLANTSDKKNIIIFSDGKLIPPGGNFYSEAVEVIRQIDTQEIHMQFYMLNPGFIFCWDNVPGNDNEKLKRFMQEYFGDIKLEDNWIENRKIIKSIDGKTIKFTTFSEKESESVKLVIYETENEVIVTVNYQVDGYETFRSRILYVKMDNGKLNIYETDKKIMTSEIIDSSTGKYYLESLAEMADGNFSLIELNERPIPDYLEKHTEISPEDTNTLTLVRLDKDHFITRYLNISGSLSEFNDVTQKVGARRLVTTSMGKPVVTSWQFGLGRVVSLSTDNGIYWAGALYSPENAGLLPSIINWVVGDPRPTQGLVVYSSDMFIGNPGNVTVHSDNLPSIKFNGQDIPVTRTEERIFTGVLNPGSQGVFPLEVSAMGVTIEDRTAVNYPVEYRDVGNNPEFLEAVKRNRGGVYNQDQAKTLLINDIRTNSVRTTVEHDDLKWILLSAALLVFLSEVISRRISGIIDTKARRKGG